MVAKITLKTCFVLIAFLTLSSTYAQTKTYATLLTSEQEVTASANAIDSDLGTKAEVRASSGIAIGVGAYAGHIEISYPTPLSANTTSYVKIDTEDDILPSLIGGNLGALLGELSGVLVAGNQEFSVAAKNNTNTVLQGDSNITGSMASDDLHVVTDSNNDYFLAITPAETYDRVRLTNRVGSLIGLNNTKNLGVFAAFENEGNGCGQPSYTSFSGSGLTLDLLDTGGAGVSQPQMAIDGDATTFSQLGLGNSSVAASIEQTIYFESTADIDHNYYVSLAINPALLQVGIANNIIIVAKNGAGATVYTTTLDSLLTVDSLALLQNDNVATITFDPEAPVDRITIQMSSLVNVGLDQQLRIHDVFSAPAMPELTTESQNVTLCTGTQADLVADMQNSDNVEIRWYDAAVDGNNIATVNSGSTFTTPVLNADTTYYVASAEVGCVGESPRTAVAINVVDIPTATDIDVVGNENPICSSTDVVLVPSSSTEGTFAWYFDANKTNPISNGMVNGSATYAIDENGIMTIDGLTEAAGPFTFYASRIEVLAGCENSQGDLKQVDVSIVDSSANATITTNVALSQSDLLNIFNGNPSTNVTGTVAGDVSAGDTITLTINGTNYSDTLASDLSFDITVNGVDVASDIDQSIETFIDNGVCTLTNRIPIDLPELIVDTLNQVFCAVDQSTVADIDVDGSSIDFFESLEATAQIDFSTPLVDGGIYFAGLLNVPNSILPRVQIVVDLIEVAPPTTISVTQIVCTDSDATISDIQVNETNVVFYDSMVGGSILSADQTLVDGEIYFAAAIEAGCESSERLEITIIMNENQPITLSGESEEVCQGSSYTYTTESGMVNYEWTVEGGTITEGGTTADAFATILWNDLQDTSVAVSYEDDQSCAPNKTIVFDVDVISCGMVLGEEFCLFVYNEFSPNNDGFNDFFKVKCIEEYSSTLKIFNRNGSLVYQTADYQNNWDGVANAAGTINSGEHLPSGTYYYVIDLPELDRNLVGWLQLAR